MIEENQDIIFKLLQSELGKHPVESYRDKIGIVKKSADHALSCIDKWMSPKKGRLPLLFFPASKKLLSEPLGVVLIIGAWNFPISLTLDPLIRAISAGNTVLIKPSELTPNCASFLANVLPVYLDHKVVKVIEGGREVTTQLLELKWDKIFFTGSTKVGKIVMAAAAKHLTPVTLELGGKCPAIFDALPNSDMKVATKRIAGGKWGPCSRQACIGIDYLLVEQKFASTLVTHQLIRDNLHETPTYGGWVEAKGPRYCPSIEDKIVRFQDKDSHQIFLEPEGRSVPDLYVQREDFWNEAIKLADLHHTNVVAFYGVVLDGPGGSVTTVTEYMVNVSLRTALQKNERNLDKRKRLLILTACYVFRDKKHRLYIVSALADTKVDLKVLSQKLGLRKYALRMAPAEAVAEILQVYISL